MLFGMSGLEDCVLATAALTHVVCCLCLRAWCVLRVCVRVCMLHDMYVV